MNLETKFLGLLTNFIICAFLTSYALQFSNLKSGNNYSVYLTRLLSTNTEELITCSHNFCLSRNKLRNEQQVQNKKYFICIP